MPEVPSWTESQYISWLREKVMYKYSHRSTPVRLQAYLKIWMKVVDLWPLIRMQITDVTRKSSSLITTATTTTTTALVLTLSAKSHCGMRRVSWRMTLNAAVVLLLFYLVFLLFILLFTTVLSPWNFSHGKLGLPCACLCLRVLSQWDFSFGKFGLPSPGNASCHIRATQPRVHAGHFLVSP